MCIQIKQTFEFKLRLVLMDKQFISYKLYYRGGFVGWTNYLINKKLVKLQLITLKEENNSIQN